MQLTVGKNSILNFSRQILNRNVQSPSSVSTVMTHHSAQPKPVWKKAPPGLQRPSRIATPSGWPSITPRYLTHTLVPALKAAGARVTATIRLLKKDNLKFNLIYLICARICYFTGRSSFHNMGVIWKICFRLFFTIFLVPS